MKNRFVAGLVGVVLAHIIVLLLGANAFIWCAVGEKYSTVRIQDRVLQNLNAQLEQVKLQNEFLQHHLQERNRGT